MAIRDADLLPGIKADLEDLRERVERLERELAAQQGDAVEPQSRVGRLPGEIDKEPLRAAVRQMMVRKGIPLDPPSWTPQDLQEEMVQAGVRPEERLGNSILAQMRGYEP